ncbi:MAG: DUF4422 domain-containing protein [Candidatus Puniceispirillaceae bacterium]
MATQQDISLFTIHHRHDPQLDRFRRHFRPIQVGFALGGPDLGVMNDDEYGRLSARNRSYCELSAFDDVSFRRLGTHVGFMHYRRMFTAPKPLALWVKDFKFLYRKMLFDIGMRQRPVQGRLKCDIRSEERLEQEITGLERFLDKGMDRYDIITPVPVTMHGNSVRNSYAEAHIVGHFDMFFETLVRQNPHLERHVQVSMKGNDLFLFNMFIMKTELFRQYWRILYDCLVEVEANIEFETLDSYQSRVLGFLAERFMPVFLSHAVNDLGARHCCLPVAGVEVG